MDTTRSCQGHNALLKSLHRQGVLQAKQSKWMEPLNAKQAGRQADSYPGRQHAPEPPCAACNQCA